jgi:hypothetical protein
MVRRGNREWDPRLGDAAASVGRPLPVGSGLRASPDPTSSGPSTGAERRRASATCLAFRRGGDLQATRLRLIVEPERQDTVDDGADTDALIRAYIACRVAIDALPRLPDHVRVQAEEPLRAFCDAVGPALAEVSPEFFER